MKMLLDTCALLWFWRDDPELSEKAAQSIENTETDAFVRVVSIREMAIKASPGKLPVRFHDAPKLETVPDDTGASAGWRIGQAVESTQLSTRVRSFSLDRNPGWLP